MNRFGLDATSGAGTGSGLRRLKPRLPAAEALHIGVLSAPITDVRDNAPFGVLCEVSIPVAGLRDHRDRAVAVTTSWELRHADDAPRLVTAYIDG